MKAIVHVELTAEINNDKLVSLIRDLDVDNPEERRKAERIIKEYIEDLVLDELSLEVDIENVEVEFEEDDEDLAWELWEEDDDCWDEEDCEEPEEEEEDEDEWLEEDEEEDWEEEL